MPSLRGLTRSTRVRQVARVLIALATAVAIAVLAFVLS